jgi:hypothetical protein
MSDNPAINREFILSLIGGSNHLFLFFSDRFFANCLGFCFASNPVYFEYASEKKISHLTSARTPTVNAIKALPGDDKPVSYSPLAWQSSYVQLLPGLA